jgi:hypothetical protein
VCLRPLQGLNMQEPLEPSTRQVQQLSACNSQLQNALCCELEVLRDFRKAYLCRT